MGNAPTTPDERFQYAVDFVLKHEGGLEVNKSDPGGETNYGISLRFLKDNDITLNGVRQCSIDDILQLTQDEAKALYKRYFWNRFGYESINDIFLASKIFDCAVNMGPKEAHEIAQEALKKLNPSYIVVDGIMGPKTIEALNDFDKKFPGMILNEIKRLSIEFYLNLVKYNAGLSPFLRGWINRANDG